MKPREALLEVLNREDGVALALARVIRQEEGWTCSLTEAKDRVRQCLKGTANRHFELDWALLVADVFVDFGLQEPITSLIDTRRRDREYRRRQSEREMRAVRPQVRGLDRRVS